MEMLQGRDALGLRAAVRKEATAGDMPGESTKAVCSC